MGRRQAAPQPSHRALSGRALGGQTIHVTRGYCYDYGEAFLISRSEIQTENLVCCCFICIVNRGTVPLTYPGGHCSKLATARGRCCWCARPALLPCNNTQLLAKRDGGRSHAHGFPCMRNLVTHDSVNNVLRAPTPAPLHSSCTSTQAHACSREPRRDARNVIVQQSQLRTWLPSVVVVPSSSSSHL